MNYIRTYAKQMDHQIIGKLTRRPEREYTTDTFSGEPKHSGYKHYSDEGGNEYIVKSGAVCIVTADDWII